MRHRVLTLGLPVLSVLIPAGLAYAWGVSWGMRDFPECASGTYFLYDMGWLVEGVVVGVTTGVVVPILLAWRRMFLLALPVLVLAGVGMLAAGERGARAGASHAGCEAFHVSDAEQALAFGLVLGAVPTVAIIGIGLGLRRFLRDRG